MKRQFSKTKIFSLLMAVGVLIAGVAPAQPLLPTAVTDFNVNNGAIGGRVNLALASGGATAFASSELTPSFGPGLLNDGLFNSSYANCWIAGGVADGEYAGIAFAGPATLSAIGFGGHDGWTGRSAGTWSLQYTTEASPGTGTTVWTQIGTYTWTLWDSMPRILFEFPAIANVTGIRLVNSNNTFASSVMQVGIQELEAYSPPVAPALTPTAVGDMTLSGSPFEMCVSAKLGGRTNLALASGGSTAFASSSLGAPFGVSIVNDGIYGIYYYSENAWIAATTADGEYAGIAFPSSVTLGAIVFESRQGFPTRSDCTWSLEYTTEASPGTGTTAWTQIGTYTWPSTAESPRLLFEFPAIANVTGIRLVSSNNLAAEVCLLELEAYGPLVVPALTPAAVGDAGVNASVGGRANLALASAGSTAFSSSELGAPFAPSQANDGANNNPFIVGNKGVNEYLAVAFPSSITLSAVAFGGWFPDRSEGLHRLEYTTSTFGGPTTNWTTIGQYYFLPPAYWVSGHGPTTVTTEMPRSYFQLAAPIANVTGVRLVFAFSAQTASEFNIQELEVYGPPMAPVITTQPVGGATIVGGAYTCTVGGVGADGYQWQKNGANISGATATSFTLNNAQNSDAANYTVVLSNAVGSVTSVVAQVSVVAVNVGSYHQKVTSESSLISYYRFDNSTANDYIGSNHGTLTGTTALGASFGDVGNLSLDLGNQNSYGWDEVGNVPAFHFSSGSGTVECWLRCNWTNGTYETSSDPVLTGLNPGIICDREQGVAENWGVFINMDKSGLFMWTGVGTGYYPITLPAPAGDSWHHLATVFSPDNSGSISLIWDGKLLTTFTNAPMGGDTSSLMHIGATASWGRGPFLGNLDEVAFYSNALSVQDINSHYLSSLSAPVINIAQAGANVMVSWSAAGTWVLESATQLSPANWTPVGTNSSPASIQIDGTRFFRLQGQYQ